MDDKTIIGAAIDGSLGLLTSTISFLSPSLGIAAVAAAPTLSEKLKEWLNKWVDEGKITPRECSRMTDGINGMSDTLLESGKHGKIRHDSLFETNSEGFCDGDDIFEQMINHIKQDSERKKAYFCGNFIGSIPYADDLNYSNLMQYSRTISQLSYSELCLICIFYIHYKNCGASFSKAEKQVANYGDPARSQLLAEVLHLRNLGVLLNFPPYNVGDNIGSVGITNYGIRLYELMRLNILDNNDITKTWEVFDKTINI